MAYIPDFSVDCPKRYSSSIHESAHACVSLGLGKSVWSLTVHDEGGGFFCPSEKSEDPDLKARGWDEIIQGLRWDPTNPGVLDNLTINFAGATAQMRLQHGNTLDGCRSDFVGGEEMLTGAGCNPEQRQTLRRFAIDKASKLVDQHWPCITMLARRLYHLRRLDRDHIMSALRRSRAGRQLLGEREPTGIVPLIDTEIVYSKPLNQYAVLWRNGEIRFFETHEAAQRATSWENAELRHRTGALTAA